MVWADLLQDSKKWQAPLNMVQNSKVPKNVGKFLTSWGTISFSRRTL